MKRNERKKLCLVKYLERQVQLIVKQTGTFSRTRTVPLVFDFYSNKPGITGWTEIIFLPLSAKATEDLWWKLKYNWGFFSSLGSLHIWMNLNGRFWKTLNSAFLFVLNMIKHVQIKMRDKWHCCAGQPLILWAVFQSMDLAASIHPVLTILLTSPWNRVSAFFIPIITGTFWSWFSSCFAFEKLASLLWAVLVH